MSEVWYDEENDILYISFSSGAYSNVINTKVLTLYLDKNGNLKGIGIKDVKKRGILDALTSLKNIIS